MVEWKCGPEGAVLMEINGRVWGSLPLAVHSGMDFPRRLADLHLYGAPRDAEPATGYQVGVRARDLELELKWIASVLLGRRRHPYLPGPRRRDVLGAALSLLDPRIQSDVQSRDDPAPGRALLRTLIRGR